jgi:hypothetical protein
MLTVAKRALVFASLLLQLETTNDLVFLPLGGIEAGLSTTRILECPSLGRIPLLLQQSKSHSQVRSAVVLPTLLLELNRVGVTTTMETMILTVVETFVMVRVCCSQIRFVGQQILVDADTGAVLNMRYLVRGCLSVSLLKIESTRRLTSSSQSRFIFSFFARPMRSVRLTRAPHNR